MKLNKFIVNLDLIYYISFQSLAFGLLLFVIRGQKGIVITHWVLQSPPALNMNEQEGELDKFLYGDGNYINLLSKWSY